MAAFDPEDLVANPVPSDDFRVAQRNASNLDSMINSDADFIAIRNGTSALTWRGILKRAGYEVPVTYAGSILIERRTQTVIYDDGGGDAVYAWIGTLPFTTTGTFEADWTLIQKLVGVPEVESIDTARLSNFSNYDIVATTSYLTGWVGTTTGPKGKANYHRDGTTSTASTLRADRLGFYDSNGHGFRIPEKDPLNSFQLGTVGNGVADDLTALQLFVDAVEVRSIQGEWGSGTFLATATVTIGGIGSNIKGSGIFDTVLKASGNFSSVLTLDATSGKTTLEHFKIDVTGQTTRCAEIVRGQTPTFNLCQFTGDGAGTELVRSTGDICVFDNCNFEALNATLTGLVFDEYNQNCIVSNCTFGGTGIGIDVRRTGANPRVEGLRVLGTTFINAGAQNIIIHDSFLTLIEGCVCDQSSLYGIFILESATKTTIDGCWVGMSAGAGRVGCIYIDDDAGDGHIISNNHIYGGERGVVIKATASTNINQVLISGNVFDNMSVASLELDSVDLCKITNNIELSATPSSGSWVTIGTNSGIGNYVFDNNHWNSAPQASFDTSATYRFGHDTGLRGHNLGAEVIGVAATTAIINHGLIAEPTVVQLTFEGVQGDPYVSSKSATQIGVTWTGSSTPTINWTASVT